MLARTARSKGFALPSTLIAYIRLPHFVPVVMVLVTTAGLAWIVAGHELTAVALIRLLLAMLGGQIVVGVVNELVDAPLDALTKPDKPIPSGAVSRTGAVAAGLAGLLLMVFAGATFGGRSLALLAVGTGLGVAYSFWFKRSRLAWLPYVLALPLLPIWAAITFGQFDRALLALYPLGALGVLAIQVAQALPDIEADRAAGIVSLTTRLGERNALRLCWGAIGGSVLLVLVGGTLVGFDGLWLWLAASFAVWVMVLNMLVHHRAPRTGVMTAFPASAVSIGSLALAWVAGVT